MSRDVKDLAGKPDAAERFEALPLDRRRGVIDTLAVVTIHRQPAPAAGSIPRRSPSTGSEFSGTFANCCNLTPEPANLEQA